LRFQRRRIRTNPHTAGDIVLPGQRPVYGTFRTLLKDQFLSSRLTPRRTSSKQKAANFGNLSREVMS
jgi:hypothetical protein